jgi:hypothetical protein
MESGLIEGDDISFEKSPEVLLMQDQEVIQTCSSPASQKAFADGMCEGAFGVGFEGP